MTRRKAISKISSAQNSAIKRLQRLYTSASFRKRENLFVVEGLREIDRCLHASHIAPQAFFFPSGFDITRYKNRERLVDLSVYLYEVTPLLFDKITYRGGATNAVLVTAENPRPLSAIELVYDSLILIVDALEKPGNLGAIFRTAGALGVDALLMCSNSQQVLHPNVIRSSLGHVFTVPYASGTPAQIFDFIQEKDIPIYTSMLHPKATPIQGIDFKGGGAIVIGAEDVGVQHFWMERATATVQIPMLGRYADSLNVSNAAAILIYEAQKQRFLDEV